MRCTQGISALLRNLLTCFNKRATFWKPRSRMPSPPLFLGLQIRSQAAREGAGSCLFFLHKHCLWILCSCFRIPGAISKLQRKNIGKEDKAEFKYCSRPPGARKDELAVMLLSMQSTRGIKSDIVGLAVPIGKPKYHYCRMLLKWHYDQRPFDKTVCDALITNGDVK